MRIKEILFKTPENDELDIVFELKRLKTELDRAYNEFQNLTDSDLLESCIYEIQALRSKYSFLLKQAKESEMSCGEVVFGAYKKAE